MVYPDPLPLLLHTVTTILKGNNDINTETLHSIIKGLMATINKQCKDHADEVLHLQYHIESLEQCVNASNHQNFLFFAAFMTYFFLV